MNINNTSFPENIQLLIQASQALSDHSSLGYDSIPSSNHQYSENIELLIRASQAISSNFSDHSSLGNDSIPPSNHQSINLKTSSVALAINLTNQYSDISDEKNKDKRKFPTEEDKSLRYRNQVAARKYRKKKKLIEENMRQQINSLIKITESDKSISSHNSLSSPSSVLNQGPSQTSIPDLFCQTIKTDESNPTAALNSKEHNESSLKRKSSFSPIKQPRSKRIPIDKKDKSEFQKRSREHSKRYREKKKLQLEVMRQQINSLIKIIENDKSISSHNSLSSPSSVLNQGPSQTSIPYLFYQTIRTDKPSPTAALNSKVHNESSLKGESSFSPVAVTNENNMGSVDDVD